MSRRPVHASAGLLEQVRGTLAGTGRPPTPEAVAEALAGSGPVLGGSGVLRSLGPVGAALVGAGPLQHLLDDPDVTDVLVNGPGQVWVDRGDGPQRVPGGPRTEDELRALAVRLAAATGRRLDDATPYVDARLPDGVRLHAVLPPVSPGGTLLSLRVPSRLDLSLEDLVRGGSVPAAWAPVLRAVVRRRLSFLVSGGTGCGKTTVLASLLGAADPAERVLLVEDSCELRPPLPHVVRLEARHGNVEGAGEVTLRELVRQALRMRPDRVVVGECRGPEVQDLLAALNTGHDGGCGTVHANTAADVPARLEALGAMAGMSRDAVTSQAASAIDVVVHLHRRGRLRLVAQVGVVQRDGDRLVVRTALERGDDPTTWTTGPGWPALARRTGADPDRPPADPPGRGDGAAPGSGA
ncbi:TadA family conjugal transfer-associated ATPase [Thalassiella azotivora]